MERSRSVVSLVVEGDRVVPAARAIEPYSALDSRCDRDSTESRDKVRQRRHRFRHRSRNKCLPRSSAPRDNRFGSRSDACVFDGVLDKSGLVGRLESLGELQLAAADVVTTNEALALSL